MKICLVSDLHLEHKPAWDWPNPLPDFDLLVAAGDIHSPPARSIDVLEKLGRPCVMVSGNHEMWRTRYERASQAAIERAARSPTVRYLTAFPGGNPSCVIGGVRFVGATLWTDYALHGDAKIGAAWAAGSMNDFRYIGRRTETEQWKRLSTRDVAWLHHLDLQSITNVLETPHDGPTVVVTHHAPSLDSVEPSQRGDGVSAAYASDLRAVIERLKPTMWLHGHTHYPCRYRIGETDVISNPKGYGPYDKHTYPRGEIPSFSLDRGIIEVPVPRLEDVKKEGWNP